MANGATRISCTGAPAAAFDRSQNHYQPIHDSEEIITFGLFAVNRPLTVELAPTLRVALLIRAMEDRGKLFGLGRCGQFFPNSMWDEFRNRPTEVIYA